MTADSADESSSAALAAAYVELQRLLLDGLDLVEFLQRVTRLATSVVPADSCGIAMRRDGVLATLATSGELAARVDEFRPGSNPGPGREALGTGIVIRVDDLSLDPRWQPYRDDALEHGVRSCVAMPLVVDGEVLGALSLYSPQPRQFDPAVQRRAESFARQAAVTLTIALRSFNRAVVENQLRDALAARSVIDQALGILMGRDRIGSREAFNRLRETSQSRNVSIRIVAAEMVQAITGHPPDPPRPFTEPR